MTIFMELLSGIIGPAIFLFFTLFCYVFLSRFTSPKARVGQEPPAAAGAWPLIGHLPLMTSNVPNKLPHFTLASLADKYGPIFTIQLGIHRTLIVSNWELAKELFTTCDVPASSRPRFKAFELLGYDMAMFSFSPYGRYWRELRKLVSVEVLSSQRLDLNKEVLVSEILQSIKELYKKWGEKKDNSGHALVEMKEWLGNLTLNVILRMVVGKRFSSDDNSVETKQCQEIMRNFFELAGVFTVGDAVPWLWWADILIEKKMKKTWKELDTLVGKWLEEHKKKDYGNNTKDEQLDFMDVMLSAVPSAELQSDYGEDTIIKSTCSVLLAGGCDTTTVSLVWLLSLLLNHPKVLKKIQEELDQHVGRERRVNVTDINKLIYLDATIKEALRLYPAAPLGGIREFTQDCNLGGYHIQKGTWLFVNLWKLQTDPTIWPNEPMEFRPERFLTTHKDIDVKGQDFELIPFGAGRRICPGIHFSLQMLHLVVANLLQSFDLSTPSDELVDMSGRNGMTNGKATPLHVYISPRVAATLY